VVEQTLLKAALLQAAGGRLHRHRRCPCDGAAVLHAVQAANPACTACTSVFWFVPRQGPLRSRVPRALDAIQHRGVRRDADGYARTEPRKVRY
jgi:hypothetical protein